MQLLKNVTLLLAAGLISLCLSDTALGQTLTVTDQSMTVIANTANPAGVLNYSTAFNVSLNQSLNVNAQTSNGQPLVTTLSLEVSRQAPNNQPPSWLRLSTGGQNPCNSLTLC